MLFNRAMCIMCRTKPESGLFAMRKGALGICADCMSKLRRTGKTMSFDAVKNADYVISPFYYKNPLKSAVYDYKFKGFYAYSGVFSALMTDALSALPHLGEFDEIIPVPLSKKRMIERGYNQSALIAKEVARFLELDYSEDMLIRIRNTKRQSSLKHYERLMNVKDAFSASDKAQGKRIIVFDDIYTTGITIEECAKTLKSAGAAAVIGVTLAIVERNVIDYEARLVF